MLEKSLELEELIKGILLKYNQPEMVVIEERLKSFRAGGTNAQAMLLLAAFNYLCQTILYKQKIPFTTINVINARSLAYKDFHKIARMIKAATKQKEYAFQLVVRELGADKFPKQIMKSGPRKGQEVFVPEAQDMSDAYILNKSAFKILKHKL